MWEPDAFATVIFPLARKITKSSFHTFCCQGKQSQDREGFYSCAPSTFTTGFSWVGWLDSYSRLSGEQKTSCGTGGCFSLDDVAKAIQQQFLTEPIKNLTLRSEAIGASRRWRPPMGKKRRYRR